MSETAAAEPQNKTVGDYVLEVLSRDDTPLDLKKLRTYLVKIPVPGFKSRGKDSLKDDRVQAAVDSLIEGEKVFVHPPSKKGGKARYAIKRPLTAEEIEAAKQKIAEEKAAEKKEAAKAKAVEKKKAAEVAAVAAIREKVLAKVAALGDEPVTESQLGKPKANASAAAATVYETVLKELLDSKKLHQHGTKYGKNPPKWFEAAPLKKKFDAVVKATKALLAADGVDFETMLPVLRRHTASVATAPASIPADVQVSAPVDIEAAVLKSFDHLLREKHFVTGLVPIHEIRAEVRQKHGNNAASHAVFDEVIREMRRSRKMGFVVLSDRSLATPDQLRDSVEVVGQLLFQMEKPNAPISS